MKETMLSSLEKQIKKIILNNYAIKNIKIVVDKTKNIENGDFFTNAAMVVSGATKKPMPEIAEIIMKELKNNPIIEKTRLIKGFINIDLNNKAKYKVLKEASDLQVDYGQFSKKNYKYNIEYVSANPTGSLHIGHARNAALGMTLNNLWKKYGIDVETEYYINDAGSQINKLGLSVFVRYLQELGVDAKMNEDWYQGEEPIMVAKEIVKEYKSKFKSVKYDDEGIKDKKVFNFFKDYSKKRMMSYIKKDLKDFRISFKRYYPESRIYEMNIVPKTIKKLGKNVFEQDGATWLRTSKYGDDKDRVIVKSNKDLTYFMPDIAYHNIKLSRGYKKIFNIFGADHNSYVTSMKAAIGCLGHNPDKMHVIVMQMVKLTKDGKEFKMSKRSGQSLTLRDLMETMGVDSGRWSLISQASDSHLEIDVQSFTEKTHDNHLFSVLYAYARINGLLQKIKKQKIEYAKSITKLNSNRERELINMIYYYPQTIKNIAEHYEIHKLPTFLFNLSNLFNSYYSEIKILSDNKDLVGERALLINAVKAVIASGLGIINIKPKTKI